MPKVGDRFRFQPTPGETLPSQSVEVIRTKEDGGFWCRFKNSYEGDVELLCKGYDVLGFGVLEREEVPQSRMHEEISLAEWRQKVRSSTWPRGG